MKLELNTARVVDDVNEESLAAALSSLTEHPFSEPEAIPVGSFVILHRSEGNYIKADRLGPDRFCLTYSDGSADGYITVEDNLELSAVQRAFQFYLSGDDRWRTEHEWKPVINPFRSGSANSGCLGLVGVFVFLFSAMMMCRTDW